MARGLTKKQRGFVKDYIKNGNGTQAAINNYNTTDENTAAVIASENLIKPKIQNAILEALPDELLSQIHREGLFASKAIYIKTEAGSEKVDEEPDYAVRHKYLDTAYKLRGDYAPEKSITVNIDSTPTERLKKIADAMNTI